jgi:non-ribosomal peptide synthetase component E (peptide arylation enzyme)
MYGVTSHMIDTYGEIIFDLSLNVQRRRGDPVRLLQMEAIEAQRADTGLTDAQIAARLGLTVAQVRFIRVVMERRRFRTDQYRKLFTLGAGRRYRPERDDLPRPQDFREDGMRLRDALTFDPAQVRTFIEAGYWTNDTLSGWLVAHALAEPHQPAIIHGEHTLSYQELHQQVTRLAGALQQHGVQRGDVVAVQLPNVPEFLLTYLAVCHLGGVLTTIHMPYRAAEMETLLRHSRARALVCLSHVRGYAPAAVVLQRRQALPALELVITHGAPVAGALSLALLLDSDPPVPPSEPPVAADPFLLLFTSGTSASPKAVPLTYHTMLSNARLGVAEHRITRQDRLLSAAPFSHLYGLYSVHLALAAGATMVLLPGCSPRPS